MVGLFSEQVVIRNKKHKMRNLPPAGEEVANS